MEHAWILGGVFFGAFFFFLSCPFFFWGGWCWLELCHFCKLWQEKLEFLPSSGFCNPTLLLGLRVLQPNTPIRDLGLCNPTLLFGLKVLQPNTSFKA